MNSASKGFTVIEVIVVSIFLIASGILFAVQRQQLLASSRDEQRKIAINSMYYNLEEVYFKQFKSYPIEITPGTLNAMDQDLLRDPNGAFVGDPASDYRYEPTGCNDDQCSGYSLRADLERESDFIRTNPKR